MLSMKRMKKDIVANVHTGVNFINQLAQSAMVPASDECYFLFDQHLH